MQTSVPSRAPAEHEGIMAGLGACPLGRGVTRSKGNDRCRVESQHGEVIISVQHGEGAGSIWPVVSGDRVASVSEVIMCLYYLLQKKDRKKIMAERVEETVNANGDSMRVCIITLMRWLQKQYSCVFFSK